MEVTGAAAAAAAAHASAMTAAATAAQVCSERLGVSPSLVPNAWHESEDLGSMGGLFGSSAQVQVTVAATIAASNTWQEDPDLDLDELGDWVPTWACRMSREQFLNLEARQIWRGLRAWGSGSKEKAVGKDMSRRACPEGQRQGEMQQNKEEIRKEGADLTGGFEDQGSDVAKRTVKIFKSGGYVMSDLKALLHASGLSHILQVTQFIQVRIQQGAEYGSEFEG